MVIDTPNDYLKWVGESVMTMRIALCGPMSSGKSFIADDLIRERGFQRVSLARGVKSLGEAVMEALMADGLIDESHRGTKQRRLLQTIGAQGRAIDADIWIRDALNQSDLHERVVIDDVRFVNEARALVAAGFKLVRLSFPDQDSQKERLRSAYPDDWERHWEARHDVSEAEHWQIPAELVSLELSVRDGPENGRLVGELIDQIMNGRMP